jgi:adenylate cyclase class IV
MPLTNVETKVPCDDLVAVAERARAAGARYEGRLDQVDTYFRVEAGRLKLREQTHHPVGGGAVTSAELIRYERPDKSGARVSGYTRLAVADGPASRAALAESHGVRGTVAKRRQLWILDATRIHLDEVERLGTFVELETIFEGTSEAFAREEHERVLALLAIRPGDALAGSYIDLSVRASS